MSGVSYMVGDDGLAFFVTTSALKKIVEEGSSAAEIKRYNGGVLKLTDPVEFAMCMTKTMDQYTCGEPGTEVVRVIDQFLDQIAYATVEAGTDAVEVMASGH